MKYKLQVQPFRKKKKGFKYRILEVTDVSIHTSKKKPSDPIKKIREAFNANQPGRVYVPIGVMQEKTIKQQKVSVLDFLMKDPKIAEMIYVEEQKGYKILIEIPSDGVPIKLGKEAEEFIDGKNGKRVVRGLAKSNNKN